MFEPWLVAVFLIGTYYAFVLLWLILGIQRIKVFKNSKNKPVNSFSIIVAFRNEEGNLTPLTQSLAQIEYPKNQFEILFVNDASTDRSVAIIQEVIQKHKHLNISLLENRRKTISPKKDAINTAIEFSEYDWILTTDADCVVSKDWLTTYDAYIKKKPVVFIAGLVLYTKRKGFIHHFQQLDWLSLLGVTMGSFGWKKPLLCSGANLGYQKKAFHQVKGFEGNEHIASGDDVFLMQKMQDTFPEKLGFLNAKQALVKTQSLNTWRALYQQRIRWAKKTGSIPNTYLKVVGVSVLLINILLIFLSFTGIFIYANLYLLLILFITKLIIDSLLLFQVSKITEQKINLINWLLSSLVYPVFSVSVVLVGMFFNFKWKERVFKS